MEALVSLHKTPVPERSLSIRSLLVHFFPVPRLVAIATRTALGLYRPRETEEESKPPATPTQGQPSQTRGQKVHGAKADGSKVGGAKVVGSQVDGSISAGPQAGGSPNGAAPSV